MTIIRAVGLGLASEVLYTLPYLSYDRGLTFTLQQSLTFAKSKDQMYGFEAMPLQTSESLHGGIIA